MYYFYSYAVSANHFQPPFYIYNFCFKKIVLEINENLKFQHSYGLIEVIFTNKQNQISNYIVLQDVKSVRIGSFSGPYFPAFGLNTEMYFVNFCIQSECEKIRTRKNPNTYNFYTMFIVMKFFGSMITKIKSIAIERPS